MNPTHVCLTLVADANLRMELFDFLSEQADLVAGFTASDATGHGPTIRLHSQAEQVKGRADRVLVRIVLEEEAARRVIDQLRAAFAGTHVVYWTTPVAKFGVID